MFIPSLSWKIEHTNGWRKEGALRTAVHNLRTVVIQAISVEEKHQQLVLLLRALLAMDLKENTALFLSAFPMFVPSLSW